MSKKIKLTDKDLKIIIKSSNIEEVFNSDRSYTDTSPDYCVYTEADDCPETKKCGQTGLCPTTINIGCEDKTKASICGCLNPQTDNCNEPRTYRNVECEESRKNCPQTGNYCETIYEVCDSRIINCEDSLDICIAPTHTCGESYDQCVQSDIKNCELPESDACMNTTDPTVLCPIEKTDLNCGSNNILCY